MARFQYEGRDKTGKVSGKLTSPSKRDAVMKLGESGIRITQISEVPESLFTKDISIGTRLNCRILLSASDNLSRNLCS